MELLEKEISRRDMLKLGLLGSAAIMLPLERTARAATTSRRLPASQLPAPFTRQLRVPPLLAPVRSDATTDYYEITMKKSPASIIPGKRTEIFGYDGIFPGPTIWARRGRQVVVRHNNRLPRRHPTLGYEPTTSVHLHGNASPPQYDGYAEDLTKPGYYKDYFYPNDQNERTLWYHDHGLHHTAQNVYMGLAGMYITDEQTTSPIPRGYGKYDVPLIINDAVFSRDGSLIYDDGGHHSLMGDVILVNGRPWPLMKVERRKYRFRVLNASLSRGYKLALSTKEPLTVIGTDAGLMAVPQQTQSLRVGMAERYEIVIDFAKYRPGSRVDLKNLDLPNNDNSSPSTKSVMRFLVTRDPSDTSNNEIPEQLNPGSGAYDPLSLNEDQAVKTRTFDFDMHESSGMWTINKWPDHSHPGWDPNRVDASPKLDDVEIWEFQNRYSNWFHPIHVHLVDFKVLDRRRILNPEEEPQPPLRFGKPSSPRNYERGAKDVVYVGEKEMVRVLMKFGPRTGKYMIHCHNLVHEDHDMMTQFEVGEGGPDPVTTAPPKPISEAKPL